MKTMFNIIKGKPQQPPIKGLLILPLLVLLPLMVNAQQRANYNMYNLYQPVINPASMGSYDQFTATGLFNAQMIGFDGAPVSFFADITAPIAKTNLVLGGQVIHDRIGARNRSQLSASVAYRVPINLRNYLSFGMTASVQLVDANFTNLTQTDPNDPLTMNQSYQLWSPDFRLGAYYFRDDFYAGISVDNIFTTSYDQPTVRINADNIHFNVHAGYNFKLNPCFNLQPSILWRQVSGSSTQFDVNLQMKYKDTFGVGVSYRTLNTIVLQTNVKVAKRFTIGYSFSMGMGIANRTEYTGHELILMYQAFKSKKKISIQTPHY
jgi:type IX secretion system PorP/SprF family membrane protein